MLYTLIKPLLFSLDAERAHHLTIQATRLAGKLLPPPVVLPSHPVTLMGLEFPNRVGLAAGLDKNAEAVDGLARLGFGFIEVGTVTPRPQPGNPKPRLFRIPAERAIINRMGFNNHGLTQLQHNLQHSRYRGIIGINIGKNFDTAIACAQDDYLSALRSAYPLASYITINISSPNTQNLRQLQDESALNALLAALKNEQKKLQDQHQRHVPLVLKIAPDLDNSQLDAIARLLCIHHIDGVIATNTTLSRTQLQSDTPVTQQSGGLSGEPLRARSTDIIFQLAQKLDGALPIIASGGILSGRDAQEKMAAGAQLVQLYSGLIYRGPALVNECIQACA